MRVIEFMHNAMFDCISQERPSHAAVFRFGRQRGESIPPVAPVEQ